MQRKWPIPVRVRSNEVRDEQLIPFMERHHAYGSTGKVGQWWAAYEDDVLKAVWLWTPALGASAEAVSPSEPSGALGLARMAAVPGPRSDAPERDWHLSKPLRWLMRRGLDRGRWPVLLSYSDAGQDHDGAVYRFSGWQLDGTRSTPNAYDADGIKRSLYVGGQRVEGLTIEDESDKTRWVHRVCAVGDEAQWMADHDWIRVGTGRTWRSGNQAFEWRQMGRQVDLFTETT